MFALSLNMAGLSFPGLEVNEQKNKTDANDFDFYLECMKEFWNYRVGSCTVL